MKVLVDCKPIELPASFAAYGVRAERMHALHLESVALHEEFGIAVPFMQGERPDPEDWIEAVMRRSAALKAAQQLGLAATTDLDRHRQLLDCRTHALRAEYLAKLPHLFSHPRQIDYARSDVFTARAGRQTLLCRNDEVDDRHSDLPMIQDGFAALRREHPDAAIWWKLATGPAKSYAVTRIAPGEDLPSDVVLATIHMGGLSLLQTEAAMGYEARFFVVDGQVISGAGCIESDTPIERDAAALVEGIMSPRLEKVRNRALATEESLLSKRLVEVAHGNAVALKAEGFAEAYVLDLFIDRDTAEIGIIEMNPINASGLYANDVDAIFMAIVQSLVRKACAA